jgi:hypothetical protein
MTICSEETLPMPTRSPRLSLLVSAGLILFASSTTVTAQVIADFEAGLPDGTEQREFEGRTVYDVVDKDGSRVLTARADGTASGLIFPTRFDPAESPWLEWRWKIDGVVESGDARTKEGDDYAARVYVIFPHWLPLRTRSINYLWANQLPRDAQLPNSYTSNAMMLALQSGNERRGEWIVERRNLVEDFRRLFGEDPPGEALIAVMTDTDQTGESAQAWYDDIRISD